MYEGLHIVILVCEVEVENEGVVLHLVLIACRTLAYETILLTTLDIVAEECHVRSEAHGEHGRKLTELLDILEEGRHVSRSPLRGRVEGNAHQLVIDERVVETILNRRSELLAVLLIERKDRDDLILEHLVHVVTDHLIVHAVTHDIEACEVCTEYETGVCTVQDSYLSLLIRSNLRNDVNVYAGLLERKLILERLRSLDVPYTEYLADIGQRIGVTILRIELCNLLRIADTARNDTVYECGAEQNLLVYPVLEVLAEAPLIDVTIYDLLQHLAVGVDQLAGKNDYAALAGLETLIEHSRHLTREGNRRLLIELRVRIINDTRLGGVRHDVLEIVGLCEIQECLKALCGVRIDAVLDSGDHTLVVYLLAILRATKVQGVETLLRINILGEALCDRLYEGYLAVPVRTLVCHIEEIVNECTEEITLTKLHHLHRCILQYISLITRLLKYLII